MKYSYRQPFRGHRLALDNNNLDTHFPDRLYEISGLAFDLEQDLKARFHLYLKLKKNWKIRRGWNSKHLNIHLILTPSGTLMTPVLKPNCREPRIAANTASTSLPVTFCNQIKRVVLSLGSNYSLKNHRSSCLSKFELKRLKANGEITIKFTNVL